MTRNLCFAVCTLLLASLAGRSVAQDKPAPPVGAPPVMMVAQAAAKGRDVILRVSVPTTVLGTKLVEVERDGKKEKEPVTIVEKYVWSEVDVKVDGKETAAFDVNGKPINPKELPKLLAKPARVAVVQSWPEFEGKLDPFYLGALKNDIVVLKGPEEKFRPLPPKK